MAYPYTPAFVAFCGGTPVDEIAAEFKIPIESLKAKMWQEGWRGLANRMAGRITVDLVPHDAALSKCERNRAKNYEAAVKLREHLTEILEHLRAGTLRIKKVFHYQGRTIEHAAQPGPADWVCIANYAMAIANMTYRALGDCVGNGGYKADVSPGAAPPVSPMTIVLPAAVANPRAERCRDVESRAIEQGDPDAAMLARLPP
jgi:hypothetical protein